MLDYDRKLPNFICLQVTRRFLDPSGLEVWNSLDTITAKLSYFENKEQKQVMYVNNRYVDIEYDRLGGGATSTGEFGNLLKGIFEAESQTEFGWERWATLRGRLHYVFRYSVLQGNSKWKIFYDKSMEITPAYSGLLFVDTDYKTVSRVVMTTQDIPPSFPVQMARTQLDYDFADIAGQQYLLPLRSELRMRSGKQPGEERSRVPLLPPLWRRRADQVRHPAGAHCRGDAEGNSGRAATGEETVK